MNEKQRQILLLISVMALLVLVFIFVDVSDIYGGEEEELNTTEVQDSEEYGALTKIIVKTKKTLIDIVKGWKSLLKFAM